MSIRDGGPAHPHLSCSYDGQCSVTDREAPGLSVRDYFAAAALTGLLALSSDDGPCGESHEEIKARLARVAYGYADALLTQRNKE